MTNMDESLRSIHRGLLEEQELNINFERHRALELHFGSSSTTIYQHNLLRSDIRLSASREHSLSSLHTQNYLQQLSMGSQMFVAIVAGVFRV